MSQKLQDDFSEDEPGSQGEGSELAFDPDQNIEEKREIRRNYRKLQDDENLLNPNAIQIGFLTQKVHTANKLFTKVKATSEATLDSAFLVTASTLGAAKARQMRADAGGFDVDDFVANLVTFMGGHRRTETRRTEDGDEVEFEESGNLDWDLIGRKALAKSRRVPVMDFMLGPLYIEPKKRVVVKRAKLDKDKEEEKRPQELSERDIEKSENETGRNVIQIEKVLEQQSEPVNMFRIIINPDSFGQSVENLFYLSFLIRDGRVALEFDDETAEPLIYLTEQPTIADYKEGVHKKQMIMELDVETWKRAKEVFNITKPMIPTREKAGIRLGDKWYG